MKKLPFCVYGTLKAGFRFDIFHRYERDVIPCYFANDGIG